MKKYILLLLATVSLYGQTYQNPTFGNLKLKNNQTSTTAEKVNVQETDGTINTISKSDLVSVVDVNDVHSLPLVGEVGKIYVVKNLNKIYRWNSTFYQELASSDLNYQSIIDALTFTPENVANKATTLTASSTLYPTNNAVIVGLATKENVSNKVTSIGSSANDTNYPSELAVKTYADNLVTGMLNDRGTWDASINAFPTTGGSGVGGAIRKGDMWYISVAGILGTKSVNVGDSFRALVNAPAQVAANWSILEANIGYVPANDSNVVHLAGTETITGVKTFNDISAVTNYKSSTNNVIISDTDGVVFRGVRSVAWSDSVNSRFFQVGNPNDNVAFTTRFGSAANRMLFSSLKTQISSGSFATSIIPLGIFEVTNGTNRFFNVFESGNSVFGGSPDDNINRLQVTGTISSGTTALGNTPPTANNQLTRKDYVDTGLATKEPSFTKNTAFNKNFGTTAGTVVEGNDSRILNGQTAFSWGNHVNGGYAFTTGSNINQSSFRAALGLGSNAYSSTAYLPLAGGTLSGKTGIALSSSGVNLNNSSFFVNNTSNTKGGVFGYNDVDDSFYINIIEHGVAAKTLNVNASQVNFSSSVTAAPATLPNHVVVKSQLDAVKPYKVYTALLSIGSGTCAEQTVYENTIGVTPSFSISNGTTILTFAGTTGNYWGQYTVSKNPFDGTSTIITSKANTFILYDANGALMNWTPTGGTRYISVEIRVYN